jgi:hypothetical protein
MRAAAVRIASTTRLSVLAIQISQPHLSQLEFAVHATKSVRVRTAAWHTASQACMDHAMERHRTTFQTGDVKGWNLLVTDVLERDKALLHHTSATAAEAWNAAPSCWSAAV